MSILKYFKNIPRSPSHRATGPKCNFFSSNLQRSPWRKKGGGLSPPPTGDRGLSPVGGATGPLFFQGLFFPGIYFELFERVFVIIVGKISVDNSYRT